MSILFGRTNTGEGGGCGGRGGGEGAPPYLHSRDFCPTEKFPNIRICQIHENTPNEQTLFLVQIMFPKNKAHRKRTSPFIKKSNLCSDNSAVISRDQKRNCICLITDPCSVQDACHVNFVIDHTHSGVSVSQW